MKSKFTFRLLACLVSVGALLLLSGCSSQTGTDTGSTTSSSPTSSQTSETVSTPQESTASETTSSEAPTSSDSASTPDSQGQTAVLYIGTPGSYQEVTVPYTGTLTPAFLVDAIAQETGWNLDLADEITQGKGGMTVDFASTSALVVGPPETQKEAYFVQDQDQLTETILDSIAHTLQYNFVDPQLGDPSSLDVYFTLNGGGITLGGETLDYTQPYTAGN